MSNLIRPKTFTDFTGQPDSVYKIKIAIKSAQMRGKPLDHILISGPAGTGKTTFVDIIAEQLGVKAYHRIGTVINKDIDLLNMLRDVSSPDRVNILFIDEIHAIPAAAQDNLLTMMEDGLLSVKQGNNVQRYGFEPITIIGATTNPGKLNKPVYDRFSHKLVFTTYTPAEMIGVVKYAASTMDTVNTIEDDAATEIARRSRGVPRLATKFVASCQDIAVVTNQTVINMAVLNETFDDLLKVDEHGLNTSTDVKVLRHLFTVYPKTVGLDSLAELLDEDARHIRTVIEPQLSALGFLERKTGGRAITPKGVAYLKEKRHLTDVDLKATSAVFSL